MPSIAELLRGFEPSLDMFEQRRRREEIARRGAEAIRELLDLIPTDPSLVEGLLLETFRRLTDESERTSIRHELEHRIAPKHELSTRKVSMRVLVELYPEALHVGQRLLDFANDRSRETDDMRLHALRMAAKLPATPVLGLQLVTLLRDETPAIVLTAMDALSSYAGIVSPQEVIHELDNQLKSTSSVEMRSRAIELLGLFAEIDALEGVMLLHLKDEREFMAVQMMVRSLLKKPRSVVRLSPKGFERLVRRLLETMNYEDVQVQQKGSWDQGVDVIAWRQEKRVKGMQRIKMVCQCKRYSRTNLVGPDIVDKMVETLQAEQAGHGIIITTSSFTPSALERVRQHQHIEWIDGAELQRLLDEHFERGFYKVFD